MSVRPFIGAILLAALAPAASLAQQEEANPAVWGIYYKCDQSKESRADEIVRETIAPVLDTHVEAGNISAWGWLAHVAGGEWRRVAYWVAADLQSALSASGAIVSELREEHGEASQELAAVCPTHDDYVWIALTGSQPTSEMAQDRATAGMSVYYECDISREAHADTLVTETLGPLLDEQVEAGNLSAWSWLSHSIGGELRKLAVYEGQDHASILRARSAVISALGEEAPDVVQEFGEICHTHHDYLWEIQMARP